MSATPALQSGSMPESGNFDALLDAVVEASARAVNEAHEEWRKDLGRISAEARAVIAELRAEVIELKQQVKDAAASLKDGAPGERGEPGADGPIGERGADGAAGAPPTREQVAIVVTAYLAANPPSDGKDGRDGIDGKDGSDGEPGPKGEDGRGLDGKDGRDGAPGEQGPAGERGDTGPQGDPGAQGEIGPQGRDGMAGARGEQGAQGERGERGDMGLPGERGADGANGERGLEGPSGKLPEVPAWADRVHYQSEVTTHDGAVYQALRDTGREPPHEDWRCIARAGRDGNDGQTFTIRGTWNAAEEYRNLDVVVLDGGSFASRRDNPGACPGEGWQLIAMRGKPGRPGDKGDVGKGVKGDPGPPVVGGVVDSTGLLTIKNADGTTADIDFAPVLSNLH